MAEQKSTVRSLQRGLRIINVVAAQGPVHAKPVARAVNLPLSTTYHLLRTLVHVGYLARLHDGAYVLNDHLQFDPGTANGTTRRCAS